MADGPLATRLEVNTPAPFVAHFFVFRFPGWAATLDGQPVPSLAPGSDGTLAIQVPVGLHVLDVAFVETSSQRAFDLVSLGALAVVAGAIVAALKGRSALPALARGPDKAREFNRGQPLHLHDSLGVAALVVVVGLAIGLKWGVFDRTDTPLVRWFDGQHPPGMAVVSRYRFGPSIELLGYTQSQDASRPGESATITLYWTTRAPLPVDYSSFLHLVDGNGQNLAVADNTHPAGLPTSRWPVDAYAPDVHALLLPASVPPGRYRIEVGIYDRRTGKQLPVSPSSPGSGDGLVLGTMVVSAP